MTIPQFYQALCVTVLVVSFLTLSVSGVSLWSRLKHRIHMDAYLQKREMADQHDKKIDMFDPKHGVVMGIPYKECDDGVFNAAFKNIGHITAVSAPIHGFLAFPHLYLHNILSKPLTTFSQKSEHGIGIDWSENSALICIPSENGTLKTNASPIYINQEARPAEHVCLNETIHYESNLPLSGNHRPLWPKFGEYSFLPPSRWVHSLEHGAVVLLYHPCMNDTRDFLALKTLLLKCLTKYIIAPYRLIPEQMPFALLAYRHAKLLSNADDLNQAKTFIETFALKGPETHVLKDGQYEFDKLHGVERITNTTKC